MRRLAAGIAMLLLAQFTAGAAFAQDRGGLSLLEENDLFFNTDRHYTNGTGIAYTTPPLTGDNWAVEAADVLPFFQDGGTGHQIRATYELGQDIFTPDDTTRVNPDPTDRPYAGFLFAAMGVLSKSDRHMDQIQIQVGVIGPASLAEDSQKFVHTLIGDAKPRGWSFQLRDEPALEVTFDRAWRTPTWHVLDGIGIDVQPHLGFAVGNVYDYANAGALLRLGYALPDDFGPVRLDPSPPGSNFVVPESPFSIYAFAGVDGRAVGRNIFLDGNSFQASRSVEKNEFVGDFLVGGAIETEYFRIAFTHVFRSREFKTQTSADQFGAVTLTVPL